LAVTAPGGKTVTVPNPLSSFKFPYIPEDFQNVTNVSAHTFPQAILDVNHDCRANATAYFQEWPETYRHAPSTPAGGSNIQELQESAGSSGIKM
jgi:tyrosinase